MDVEPLDWTIAPDALDRALKKSGARAVILGAPFGFRRDFSAHVAIARQYGAVVIIDNAAGVGVLRRALEDGGGVYEVYSLHATKPFAAGEGGTIYAHRSDEAALRSALNFGLPTAPRGAAPLWGINGKLSEIHAAIGLAALDGFELRLAHRRAMASAYMQAFAAFGGVRFETDPAAAAWQVFPVLTPSRAAADRLVESARLSGMEVRRYYSPSLSRLGDVGRLGNCAISEDLAARMCCFPVYASGTETEREAMLTIAAVAVEAGLAAR